jgi:hypothetical protein
MTKQSRRNQTGQEQAIRTTAWGLLIAAAWALLVPACDSSADHGPVPIDDVLDQVMAADCALLVRCHVFSDASLCSLYFGPSQTGINGLDAAVNAAKAGKIQYDPVAARGCLDALYAVSCGDFDRAAAAAPEACRKTFTGGALPDGARCIADAECVAGSWCAPTSLGGNGCDGTCTPGGTLCNDDTQCSGGQVCDTEQGTAFSRGMCGPPVPPGALNQPCGTNRRCQDGLFCSDAGRICVAPLAAGQPCSLMGITGGCADGLVCVFADDDRSASCMRPADKGGSCQVRGQCGGLLSTITCDPTTHVCVDLPSSGPCVGTRLSCNPLSSYCDVSGGTPTCKPYLAVGAPCTVTSAACGLPGVATCVPSDATPLGGTCTAAIAPLSCTP